jgi:OOP family OmpA-OmpF porin
MHFRKVLIVAGLAASGVLATPYASAQGFIGGAIGQGDIDDEVTTGLITSGTVDGKDSAWKIFGGYMFNRHFGVELAYVDLGEATYSGQFGVQPVTGGTVEMNGFNVSVLGAYPVSEQFSIFGKVGLFAWEAQARDTTSGVPFSATRDGADISFGVGAGYQFTRSFGVRAEWEMFATDVADASLISVGVLWRF